MYWSHNANGLEIERRRVSTTGLQTRATQGRWPEKPNVPPFMDAPNDYYTYQSTADIYSKPAALPTGHYVTEVKRRSGILESNQWRERMNKEKVALDSSWDQVEAFRMRPEPQRSGYQTARGGMPPRRMGGRTQDGSQTARSYHTRAPHSINSLRSGSPPLVRKRPFLADNVSRGLPPVDINFALNCPPSTITHPVHSAGLPSGNESIFADAGGHKMCAITRWKEDLLMSKTKV